MIVTCPACSAKYRVRNDAVPEEGARLRCPGCDTLFLARLPADASASAQDDPSTLYQQLTPAAAPPRVAAAPSRAPSEGPSRAPAAASQPPSPAAPRTSAGAVAGPPPVAQAAPAPRAPAARPSGAVGAASWAVLGLGACACGAALLLSLWAAEVLPLDPLLMPAAERALGVEPPHSFTGRTAPVVDTLREEADAAFARGDLAAALVLWQRVKQWSPNDPRAVVQIAKLRTELGDLRGSP